MVPNRFESRCVDEPLLLYPMDIVEAFVALNLSGILDGLTVCRWLNQGVQHDVALAVNNRDFAGNVLAQGAKLSPDLVHFAVNGEVLGYTVIRIKL